MAVVAQSRTQKVEKYGLEVPKRLTYQEWEPGGTYTKSLVMKNIKIKTQKIKIKLSSKQFFCAVYPHPVTLSAGNSYTIPITFKPVEQNEYKETVQIDTSEGTFTVPLCAVLAKPKLSLPATIQFGLCGVEDTISMGFEINNIGSVSTDFYWECSGPFVINPSNGSLGPKQSCKLEAVFKPLIASVYNVTALCHYGDEYHDSKVMKLDGIGKYPHLLVRKICGENRSEDECYNGELTLSFNEVSLCSTGESTIHIVNTTSVPASFNLIPESQTQTQDPVFSFSKSRGTVPPLDKLPIKVFYNPSYTGQCNISHYSLVTKGGLAKTRLTCSGSSIGPSVSLDKSCVNFGNIECGHTSRAVINIRNTSTTPTIYQFQLDPSGIFHTDTPSSELMGGTSHTIIIHFTPRKPIPYHRRVVCLVLNQEPLDIHFIGSAYTETIQPAQLSAHHISLYNDMSYSGLSKLPPEYLQQCIDNGSLTINEHGTLIPDEIFNPPLKELNPSNNNNEINKFSSLFKQGCDPSESKHIIIDTEYIQFGYITSYKSSEGKVITVTNETQGTVSCVWMTGQGEVFQVLPAEREIPPNTTVAFAISFWPNQSNQLFSKQLECYVFYKVLSDYTQVDSQLITLPWCLTLLATGHSFSPGVEPFHPSLSISNKTIVFPSTVPNKPTYRSIVMKNHGNTPIMYRFTQDNNQIFRIKPSCGLIVDSYHICIIEMLPKTAGTLNKHIVECCLNDCSDFKQELVLSGISEIPKLQIDKECLFFKPTCVGGSSYASVVITNPCGLPIKSAWQIRGQGNHVVKIQPLTTTLPPNGRVTVKFKFIPHEIKQYCFTAVITSLLDGYNVEGGSQRYKKALRLYGEGTTGDIECTSSELDCGHVVIGTSSQTNITLQNTSSCTLGFKLGVKQTIETKDGQKEEVPVGKKPHGLELSFNEGELEEYSNQSLILTLRPSQTAKLTSQIFYQLVLPHDEGTENQQWKLLCSVTVHGSYPSLCILDVKGDGVSGYLSKSQIWKTLQVDRINQYLQNDPSPIELRYAISTRHSTTRKVPILTHAVLDFNLGAAPLNRDSHSTYYLLLANTGSVETQWAFRFPMDIYLEPEYWAETGQIDPSEQHELDVVKNGLFFVSPKEGKLLAGERVIIKCSYKHSHLGISQLPVLLKINRGREIMLNFIGITSELNTPYITLPSYTHTFHPVPVDNHTYPIQVFGLNNTGDTPARYTIDISSLEEMKKYNYNTSILKCLTPEGELPPQKTTMIEFIFSPSEAKLYSVEVPIYFTDGHTEVVTFRGEGIHYDTNITNEVQEKTNSKIPHQSAITLPGQLADLSQDILSLGDIPLFGVVRHLIYLRNLSNHTLSYQWMIDSHEAISIEPSTGYLQPGKSIECRMTFHSKSAPTLYNLNVVCVITNESEMCLYNIKYREWEDEEEEKRQGFIITDKRDKKTKYKLNDETYEDWLKKDLSVKNKTRARRRRKHHTEAPVLPKPDVLHLGITARTYSISDYCTLFNDFDSFQIDYQSVLVGAIPIPRHGNEDIVNVNQTEMSVVEITLTQALQELLEDTNFHASLTSVTKEAIPYYAQFKTYKGETSSGEKAARHVYASAQEGLPSSIESLEPASSEDLQDKRDVDEGSELSIRLPDPIPPISAMKENDIVGEKIRHLPEFHSFTEHITENILLNIIREVSNGELNLTAPIFTIAKPPH